MVSGVPSVMCSGFLSCAVVMVMMYDGECKGTGDCNLSLRKNSQSACRINLLHNKILLEMFTLSYLLKPSDGATGHIGRPYPIPYHG